MDFEYSKKWVKETMKENQITYSIIIPHRDSLVLLERALLSIPDRNDIQIIVIDNTPGELSFSTLEKIRENKIILLFSNIEKGAGHARNIGLNKAIGKWLLFLDADDFFNPGALSILINILTLNTILFFSQQLVYIPIH